MNILVTGATGFVGNHLVKRLIEKGNSAKCLVRKDSNTSNLKRLKVDLLEGDLLKKDTLDGIIDKIDVVYHLAGEVYSKRSTLFYKGNVLTTKNLLEVCKWSNIKKFVYVSSIAVYKPPMDKKLLTENSPCEPLTPYGRNKLEAERLIMYFYDNEHIPVAIVRAPVIYGPNESEVLNNFFLRILKKRKMSIIGDGENFRSLCYIDNFLDGLLLVGEEIKSIGKIYNISDSTVYTFNEILKVASKIIGQKINITYFPKWVGDMLWLLYNIAVKFLGIYFIELYSIKTMTLNLGCDISRIQKELGYQPSVGLKDGLQRTFDWIRGTYG